MRRAQSTLLLVLVLAAPPAAATKAPLLAEARALVERHFHQGGAAIRPEAELARVATANSEALAETGPNTPAHAASYLRFLLERHGVRDAVTQALALRLPADDLPELRRQVLAFLRQRAAGRDLTHYGVGWALRAPTDRAARPAPECGRSCRDQEAIVTLILLRRRVVLTAVRARLGQPLRLCGQLLSGRQPRVYATTPGGQVIERLPAIQVVGSRQLRAAPGLRGVAPAARRFCVALPRATRGRYQVEIMVDGPLGPEVAALFPLHIGAEPPALPEEKLYPPARSSPRAVEQRLLTLLNRSRALARVPPLRRCDKLVAAARVHSVDMMQSGFFGHRAPLRGSLAARLAAEGIDDFLLASENLALSTDPERAHDALLASPSHRKSLLDPRMTHVGIGALRDREDRLYYITQCFARLADADVCQ